jgi:hypothetical protein
LWALVRGRWDLPRARLAWGSRARAIARRQTARTGVRGVDEAIAVLWGRRAISLRPDHAPELAGRVHDRVD